MNASHLQGVISARHLKADMLLEELGQVMSPHDESFTLRPLAALDGQAELLLQILNLLQDTCHLELQTLVPGILPLLHLQTQNTVHFHLLNMVHFHLLNTVHFHLLNIFVFTCKYGSLSPKHSSLLPAKHSSLSPAEPGSLSPAKYSLLLPAKHSLLSPAKHSSLSPALLNLVHFDKKQNKAQRACGEKAHKGVN